MSDRSSSRRIFSNLSISETPLNSYLLLFLLLVGIAFLVSPLPQVSLPKLIVIILGAVTFFFMLPHLNRPDLIWLLVAALAFCAGLIALAGFFTLEWPERQVINLRPVTDRLPHLSGSFYINNNEMAGTLLMLFPFVLVVQRKLNGQFSKVLYSFHLLILIVMLFFTQSRGALLTICFIGLTWLLWGIVPIRRVAITLMSVCLVLLVSALLLDVSLSDTLAWLSTIDAGSKQGDVPANSWLTRVEIWQVAGQMLSDYPVIGAGLYTFDPVSRANYVYETIQPSFNLTHAHNLLLQTGASLGVGGLLALIGIWATALVELWRASRSGNEHLRRFSAVFAASIVGYLIFNLFDTITFGQKPGIFAWIILAGAVSVSRMAGNQPTAAAHTGTKRPFLTINRAASLVPMLAFLILLLSPAFERNLANLKLDRAYLQPGLSTVVSTADFPNDARRTGLVHYLAGNYSQALRYWRLDPQGEIYLQSQGTIALTSGNIGAAISWYDLALELTPNSAETYLWRAVANEERGTIGLAEADFRRAIRYMVASEETNSVNAYTHYRLGNLLAEKGEWQAAAESFAQAARYEPDEAWYHKELGDALTIIGDEAGAAAAYQKGNQ